MLRCMVRSRGGGAVAPECGGGQGCHGQGELEKGLLGAPKEFLSFLRLVNRPVFLNGRELNFRGRYSGCFPKHEDFHGTRGAEPLVVFVIRGLCCTGPAWKPSEKFSNPQEGSTLLHAAARSGQDATLRALVEAGADITAKDKVLAKGGAEGADARRDKIFWG